MHLKKLLVMISISLIVTACGTSESPTTVTPEPSVTPIANAPVAAATATATTVTSTIPGLIQTAKTALEQNDFDGAINMLTQAYNLEPSNTGVIETLATAYLLAGNDQLNQLDANPKALRNAITFFHEGKKIAGNESTLAQQFVINIEASQAMTEAREAQATFRQLTEQKATFAEREATANHMNELVSNIETLRADFPTLEVMQYQAWLNIATVKEEAGDNAEKFPARSEIWRVALDWCEQAAQLTLPDRSTAQACIERLNQKLIPPTAVPTPKPTAVPQPTAKPRPTAVPEQPKLRFWKDGVGDSPTCVSMQITGIGVAGWFFHLHGSEIRGYFDGGGNARACGLGQFQEFYFTVYDGNGNAVRGGSGVPTRGGDFMKAVWR